MKRLAIRLDYATVILLPAEAMSLMTNVEFAKSEGYNDWDKLYLAPDHKLDFRLLDDACIAPPPKSEAEKEAERQALREKAQALLAQAEAI